MILMDKHDNQSTLSRRDKTIIEIKEKKTAPEEPDILFCPAGAMGRSIYILSNKRLASPGPEYKVPAQ